MLKREKEFFQYMLDNEEEVIKALEKHYRDALSDINMSIRIMQADQLTQSKVYQLQYQQALKKQVEGILERLHAKEYTTIQQYLSDSYTNGFVGSMYSMHGQGIPMIATVDQNAAVKAVITDSQIREGLYDHLAVGVDGMKKAIREELTRGIASNMDYDDIARNIAFSTKASLANTKNIVRTEGHRIQQASADDARHYAASRGADMLKQWDATLDGNTRKSHRELDGTLVELDEFFVIGTKKARYPGDFGDPALDCQCRCVALDRPRWALDEAELEALKERAAFFKLDKTDSFEDFKKKYLKAGEKVQSYNSNPYVFDASDLPPATYQYSKYDDYSAAVVEWKKTHDGSPYDYYVQNSVWGTTGLTEEQVQRIKQFDATIAKLQVDYPLSANAEKLYVGSFEHVDDYLTDIQASRMEPGIAQAQFWFNPEKHTAVVAFNPVGTSGNLVDDLILREQKIAKGERLTTVLDHSPEGYAIHEWGHGYTEYISQEMIYGNPSAEAYWKWYKSLSKEEIADGISTYAMTNRAEFEAECFAELLTGNPRPIAVKFSEYLKKCTEDAMKRLEMYGSDAVKSGTAGKIDLALNYAYKRDTSSLKTIILPKQEYAHVMSEIATNMTEAQKQQWIVSKPIGNYVYTFENHGFGEYRIIGKKPIDADAAEWWDE